MPFGWRPDGDVVRDVPANRRIMPYLFRTRNECSVLFEQKVELHKARDVLAEIRSRTGMHATLLHLLIWASARTIAARPRLNRFTAGGRIFQRRGIWISFSAKKGKTDDDPIVLVKRKIEASWSLEDVVREIESGIQEGRSDKLSATDKELALIFLLPHFMVRWLARIVMWLDENGWLPGAMIRSDPLFASMFIANLGSIQMDAGFHHLFEYGSIPIFLTAGQAHKEVVVGEDGAPAVRELLTLRYNFDERIEDGLYCLRALEILKERIEDPLGEAPGVAQSQQEALASP